MAKENKSQPHLIIDLTQIGITDDILTASASEVAEKYSPFKALAENLAAGFIAHSVQSTSLDYNRKRYVEGRTLDPMWYVFAKLIWSVMSAKGLLGMARAAESGEMPAEKKTTKATGKRER